jgi:hypothetical protein
MKQRSSRESTVKSRKRGTRDSRLAEASTVRVGSRRRDDKVNQVRGVVQVED